MQLKSILFLILNLISLEAYAQTEKMIFAIDVIRHGDRTPIYTIPDAPYSWPQGTGQLTARGMQQEYLLGVELRQRYVKKYHLLPANYHNEMMLVRSTDFDRTLMSAQSLLAGLYPLGTGPMLPQVNQPALPAAQQPIPIHTVPLAEDTLLLPDHDIDAYQEMKKKYVYSQPEWKQKTAELQPQFARWNQWTGSHITNIDEAGPLADTLYIRQLYHIALPKGLSETDAKKISEAGKWAFVTTYKNPPIGYNTGHLAVVTIGEYFQKATTKKTKLKYILFSGHDSTILSILSAMGAPLDQPPRYASDLNFALWETAANHYIVRVTFNGQPVKIPGCGNAKFCELSQFLNNNTSALNFRSGDSMHIST